LNGRAFWIRKLGNLEASQIVFKAFEELFWRVARDLDPVRVLSLAFGEIIS
jgi:hypothetical protein